MDYRFPFSYTALDKTPTGNELDAFRKQYPKIAGSKVLVYYTGFLVTAMILFFVLLFASFVLFDIYHGAAAVINILVIFAAIIALAMYGTYRGVKKYYFSQVAKRYTMFGFARENQLEYSVRDAAVDEQGMIFGVGHDRRYASRFSDKNGMFSFGNYQYSLGSGKSERTYMWGVVKVKLERAVPNMVLDAKSNNINFFGYSKSNLPEAINKSQTLKLEGDFNNYFTLYAPKAYEKDALYIFTPDLMSLLVDEGRKYDVETVGDALYIYSDGRFVLDMRVELERISEMIKTIGAKTVARTDMYRDERVADSQSTAIKNQVAAPGRRLKRNLTGTIVSVTLTTLIAIAVFYLETR